MRLTLLAFSLISLSLFAEIPDESQFVSSTKASFDGNNLLLQGHVILEHSIGKLCAEKASLQRQESSKDFPFSLIDLEKDVLVTLPSDATLTCNQAHLDFISLKGLLSSADTGQVIYMDNIIQSKGDTVPFYMQGKTVDLALNKHEASSEKTEYKIDSITSNKNVLLKYGTLFSLKADRAVYTSLAKSGMKKSHGTVSAFPEEPNDRCYLEHKNGKVDAQSFHFNFLTQEISLVHPKGKLFLSFGQNPKLQEVSFRSDDLIWNQLSHLLFLKKNVEIHDPSLGNIQAKEEVSFFGKDINNIQMLQTKGYSVLEYQEQSRASAHRLISYGILRIDRAHGNAIAESPEKQGKVLQNEQLYYEEDELSMYADKASMEFSTTTDNTVQPISVTLKNNVRLISHNSQKPDRCALADRVTYSPGTRTFILSANPGKKVLLWDQNETIQISANEIHITQEPGEKKEAIKGVGNVKFTFSQEEQSLLEKIFPNIEL